MIGLDKDTHGRLWSFRKKATRIKSNEIIPRDIEGYIDINTKEEYAGVKKESYNAIDYKGNHINAFVNKDKFLKVETWQD